MDPSRLPGVVTPEAVALSVDVAGLGSRMIAAMIDLLIQGATALGVGFAFAGLGGVFSGTWLTIVLIVLLFTIFWGYYPLFEGLWGGTTPGKRAQRLRVVTIDGQPVTIGPVLVRNFLRIVDFIPGAYAVGVLTMLLTRRSQRLGDLAGGTMVIRERKAPEPQELRLLPNASRDEVSRRLDVTALADREYELVRSFLQRREALRPDARSALAHTIASALRTSVHAPAIDVDDETFLEAVASAIRARSGRSAP
ncbi:MAG: RDD family protein [Actinomycetota bacterium]